MQSGFMRRTLILYLRRLILLLCSGCSIPPFKPQGAHKHITLSIIIDNDIWVDGEKVKGTAQCGGVSPHRFCILRVPSIETLDDFDWYYWGKELGHVYFDNYHEGIDDIY